MNTSLPEPRLPRWAIALIVLATFLAVNAIGLVPFRAWAAGLTGWPRMAALAGLGYGLYLLVPLAVAAALFGPRRMFAALGLAASPWPALALAAVCTAPVWIGYPLLADVVDTPSIPIAVVRGAVLPGMAEEILFRAFLFGFLYRFAGWRFLPAALMSAVVFGIEHLYQGSSLPEALAIAALTGLAGLWWSWLLLHWRWNAWVPIGFHVSMNAAFEVFAVADNALGPTTTILLRVACIVLSIIATCAMARRRDESRGGAFPNRVCSFP